MTEAQAHTAIVVSALTVGAVYAYRKLIEPASTVVNAKTPSSLENLIGAGSTPANAAQFAVGFGFVFVSLAVISTFAPSVAGGFAIIIAVGEILVNGSALFVDVTHGATAATKTGKAKN